MRFHLGLASKAKRLLFSSPVKKKAVNGENPVGEMGVKSQHGASGFSFRSPDYAGSKEETFFDSKAWLDSDCEDDFYSVHGDFTPSRGNTPNRQFGAPKTPPQLDKPAFGGESLDTKSESSPTERKKKLADLLHETLHSEEAGNEANAINGKVEVINGATDKFKPDADHHLKSSEGTPHLSGRVSVCSSEVTPGIESKLRGERKHMNCCFPSLIPSFSFHERKRDKMSPQSFRR